MSCYTGNNTWAHNWKLRKTKPQTATRYGHKYFDYHQCTKCKFNKATGNG